MSIQLSMSDGGVDSAIVAAAIGAFVSVVTAAAGALVVFAQIGRQGKAALEQDRENERMKLKVGLYRDVISACAVASDSVTRFSSYVRNFVTAVDLAKDSKQMYNAWGSPSARVPELSRIKIAASDSVIEFVMLVERWMIVDSRLDVFRYAFGSALERVSSLSNGDYHQIAMALYPIDVPPDHPAAQWQVPGDEWIDELHKRSDALVEALQEVQSFIYDFQIESQNLLLGGLFGNSILSRKPIDPKYVVVRLADHESLIAHFLKNTHWGQLQGEAMQAAQANAGQSQGA